MNPNPMNHGRFVGNWQNPQPPAYQAPQVQQPNANQSFELFKQLNPHLFNQPQVTATFDGKPIAWTGGPSMRPGTTLQNGAYVATGAGGGASAPGPIHTAYNGNGVAPQQQPATPQNPIQAIYGNMLNSANQMFSDIPKQIQADQDRANAANEQRYQQLLGNNQQDTNQLLQALGGWNSLIGQGLKDKSEVLGVMNPALDKIVSLAGQDSTKAAMQREDRLRQQQLGANAQNLTSRGLVNSTILDATNRGINDDSALRQQGIQDAGTLRELAARQFAVGQQIPTLMGLNQNVQNLGIGQLQQLIPTLMHQNDSRQNIIENKVEQGPNTALYTSLLQQAGAQQNAALQAQLQLAQMQQNNQSQNQYAQLMSSLFGQMPVQYARPTGSNGNSRGRPGAHLNMGSGQEEHTGATDFNTGYNANPGGYGTSGSGSGGNAGGGYGPTPWGGRRLADGTPMPAGAAGYGTPPADMGEAWHQFQAGNPIDWWQSTFGGDPSSPVMAGPDDTLPDWLKAMVGMGGGAFA